MQINHNFTKTTETWTYRNNHPVETIFATKEQATDYLNKVIVDLQGLIEKLGVQQNVKEGN